MESTFDRQRLPMVLIFFILEISLLSACTFHNKTSQVNLPSVSSIRKDGNLSFLAPTGVVRASIAIEIADTPETQMKGLMGRNALDDDKGMLFVFEHLKPQKFWMKNTTVPLDIIFVGSDGCIVNIAESTPPMSNQRYRSKGPIRYVVEVRAGFAKRYKIDSNTCIQWRRL